MTFLAAYASHLTMLLLGAIGGWLGKVAHNWLLKYEAEKKNAQAISNAGSSDNTGDLFGGGPSK